MDVVVTVLLTIGGSIVGVIVTILVAKWFRSRKELSAYVLSFDSTFSVTEWIKDKITIRYKNKKVQSLSRLRLVLKNTGNKGIKKVDIVEPIRVSLPDSESFIEVSKHSSTFENYSIVSVSPNILEFQFDLMNPGDVIAVELLTAQDKLGSLFIEGRGTELRIKWQKTIKIVGGTKKTIRNLLITTSILSLFTLIFIGFSWFSSGIIDLLGNPIVIVIICFLFVFFLFGIGFITWLISVMVRLKKKRKLSEYYGDSAE